MSTHRNGEAQRGWKSELRATPDCIPVERFGSELTEVEIRHLSHCARCEAEVALWREFEEAQPVPEEGAAVQWIAAELRRRLDPAVAPARSRWVAWLDGMRTRSFATALAGVVVIAGVTVFIAQDREPAIGIGAAGKSIYRSAAVEVDGPVGDIARAPAEFRWRPAAGAARYDIELMEVDRNVLWRATVQASAIMLPAGVRALCVPGKTLLWRVTARDRSGTVTAQSSPQRFRVKTKAVPDGE